MTLCNCLSFSSSPSRQDFGRTGNFFLAYVLIVVAFNACEPIFTGDTGNCFVEVSCIAISGACSQDPLQLRRAEHAFESC